MKPTITNPNIVVGDYTYISDVDFEKHVIHHYPFYGDRLVIGRFCQIAAGVTFIMNGANHRMTCASTYPFYIFVVGNPARVVRQRFDEELTGLLLQFRWWDLPIEEVNELLPVLASSDFEWVKAELRRRMTAECTRW